MKRILSILFVSLAMMFSMVNAAESKGYGTMKNTSRTFKTMSKEMSARMNAYKFVPGSVVTIRNIARKQRTAAFPLITRLTYAIPSISHNDIHLAIAGSANGFRYDWSRKISKANNDQSSPYFDAALTIETASITTFCYSEGTESESQDFSVSGTGLTNDVVIIAPDGFEVKRDVDPAYASSFTINNEGDIDNLVNIRVASTASGDFSGLVTIGEVDGNFVTFEVSATTKKEWLKDGDSDGFYDEVAITACSSDPGWILASSYTGTAYDCDDIRTDINPNTEWYQDFDDDGYYDEVLVTACASAARYILASEFTETVFDCNDNDNTVTAAATWYADIDGDTYGDPESSMQSCTQPDGYVSDFTDCDVTNAEINPETIWYVDEDRDQYYDGNTITACSTEDTRYVLESDLISTAIDCDDTDPLINPGATEIPGNDVDENCDGTAAGLGTIINVNSPHSYQYSDPEDNSKPIRIHLTDVNGVPLPDGAGVTIVAYNQKSDGTTYYGSGLVSGSVPLTVLGGQGFAVTETKLSLLFPELEARKIDKQDDPASWPRAYIKVNFAGGEVDGGMYDASERIASIVVRRENANFVPLGLNAETDKIKFNGIAGSGYIVTSNTSENVKFTVKIADIADGYPGNINKAKVKFVLNPAGSTTETVLYDTDGFVDGIAEATFNVSCGTLGANPYNVQVFIEGNYRGRLNTTLTMHKTNSSEVISAGGDFLVSGSKGIYAGTEGSVTRFGFGAKYNKTATNVQGKATLIFTNGGRTYQVTGNGTPIITMDATTGLATYNSKASITDVTSDGADATVSALNSPSGLRMEYSMTDAIPDIIAVRVYDATTSANTLWFSNKGTGSLSDKQSLTRGGITVKASTTTTGTKTGGKKELVNVSAEMMNENMAARIIPNPSANEFTLFTNGNGNETIQVRLMDISGRLLKQYQINAGSTLKFGQELRNGMYIVQMIQNSKTDIFRIVKQQ